MIKNLICKTNRIAYLKNNNNQIYKNNRYLSTTSNNNNNNNNNNLKTPPPTSSSLFNIEKPITKENERLLQDLKDEMEEDLDAEFAPYVNPITKEIGGPRGPEPTRYNDWERNGRVSDF